MRRIMAAIVTLALLPAPGSFVYSEPSDQTPLEYKVKAAYVFNFARFVTWPSKDQSQPIVIGLVGDDPFFAVLESALSGATVEARPIKVKRVNGPEDMDQVGMLYISPSVDEQIPYFLSLTRGKPILTVGETRRFIAQGGMVRLFTSKEKVMFAVNPRRVERAGLQVSSQMLQYARVEP